MKVEQKIKPNTSNSTKNAVYSGQKWIDVGLMIVFAGLLVLATKNIDEGITTIRELSLIDVATLVFATFRCTQLFMLDNVTQWFRDLFFNTKVRHIGPEYEVDKEKPTEGVRREVAILLDCPWCTSVWVSLGILYFWLAWPATHLFIYVMALSGISTILYLLVKKLEK